MNLERPRYEYEGVNQNVIDEMHNNLYTRNAIRVKNNIELHIAPQNISNENMIDPNQTKLHELEKIKQK